MRILNLISCRLSYLLSLFGVYRFRHLPEFLSVEPANWCMLHCPECPVGMRGEGLKVKGERLKVKGAQFTDRSNKERKERKLLSLDLFRKILKECTTVHTIQFFFQGEPLLNQQLPEFIRLAKQKHIYTIVSTNALLLTSESAEQLICSGIDRIIVSIDGYSEASYQQYRVGGTLGKALEGLQYLSAAKRKHHSRCIIEWQCLMLRSNQDEWPLIRQNYRLLGADRLTFKTAQFQEFQHGNPLMPDDERYSRYQQTSLGVFVRKKPYRNHCLRLWSGAVIDSQGNVLPCCFDKQQQYVFGNIRHSSLAKIWHSPEAEAFRRKLMSERTSIPICFNCTE